MTAAGEIVQRNGVTYVVRDGAPEEIPVLDLSGYLSGMPGAREVLVDALRRAQENIGFYYIVGHGIPQRVFDDTFVALKRFFARPKAAKLALKIDDSMIGHVPPKSILYETSTVNRNTKKDLNETLLINREQPAADTVFRAGRRFTAPNKWPADLPGFRRRWSPTSGRWSRSAASCCRSMLWRSTSRPIISRRTSTTIRTSSAATRTIRRSRSKTT
ncbi:MAG: hypothetical protein FJX53_14515, partial [Alphaproteobacteria bacterium]|nr:hypothetical protein [Alphaproteobacteria bacterium]